MGDAKYAKVKDQDPPVDVAVAVDAEGKEKAAIATSLVENANDVMRKTAVTIALCILTSSQGLLIALSKRSGHFNYSVTSANCMVEMTKCLISFGSLVGIWRTVGINDDNRINTNWQELWVYPVPALLYLIKNLMQYFIFLYVDAPSYQILKNLNIISTGVLYRIFLKKRLNGVLGCTIAQMNNNSDHVLSTPAVGVVLALVMALLSGAAGVYTEMIIKKRPQRSIHVQNLYLYSFGILFNVIAIFTYDHEAVFANGFFAGYDWITFIMILNHALSGLAVSMVMKFANNIVKVYATSVAMLMTTLVSIPLFGFQLTLPFVLGTSVVCVAVFLHYQTKMK
eukprot:CAMPEP_0177755804 /NCGR_PEP_ID=MMETSP0491_2-20121128/2766_1 /TAXON_ID=63592 /ORGANISM="Tetraselmis chuii, Strain PLY429" /LENGTH=338 /DNA_ID=CAMNT_0019271335 /DNA_START=122 /DNA_END=1138 /DNA_ORIENTATION=+